MFNILNILTLNIQSIHTNHKLKTLAHSSRNTHQPIHVYALTETHTSPEHTIHIPGYTTYAHHNTHVNDKANNKHKTSIHPFTKGGLMFIVHNSLHAQFIPNFPDYQSTQCSTAAMCITMYLCNVKFYVCLVYRHPSCSDAIYTQLYSYIKRIIDIGEDERIPTLITGDFNTNPSHTTHHTYFNNFIFNNNLSSLNDIYTDNQPTHRDGNTLDITLCNTYATHTIHSFAVSPDQHPYLCALSDHFPTITSLHTPQSFHPYIHTHADTQPRTHHPAIVSVSNDGLYTRKYDTNNIDINKW